MKSSLLAIVLVVALADAEGRTCFVGQGQAVEQMYAPSQPFSLLFDPANYLVAPKSPVSGSPINCDTGVSGAANSSHCVNYLSASKLTRTFTCSEPSISGSTVNNKCSAGIVLANVDCCNATDACNAPAAAASITTAAVTATCRSTPVGRNGKLKATVPLSAAMVMELFNSTGMHTTRVLASLAAPAQHIPPLDAGNFLQEAIDLQCQSEISQKGSASCVTMIVKNFMGMAVTYPIYSCLSAPLIGIGMSAGAAPNSVVSGTNAVSTVYSEALDFFYRTTALANATLPSIPTPSDAQKTQILNDVTKLAGPSEIKYTPCSGNNCNAEPAVSTGMCFSLNKGALALAKEKVDKGNQLGALASFINTPRSCKDTPGHIDACVTVSFAGFSNNADVSSPSDGYLALGTALFAGCYSPFLEGVGFPDMKGGALPVDCGSDGIKTGTFPIPPQFLFGLPVPLDQIMYKCCKGTLCNADAAFSVTSLKAGVDATVEIGGVADLKEFVDLVHIPMEEATSKRTGVPKSFVITPRFCVAASCTWFISDPPKMRRRATGATMEAEIHVNAEGALPQDNIMKILKESFFEINVRDAIMTASPSLKDKLTIKISNVATSAGGVRSTKLLNGGTRPAAALGFTVSAAIASLFALLVY